MNQHIKINSNYEDSKSITEEVKGKHSEVEVMNCKGIRGMKARKLETMAASLLQPPAIKLCAAAALVSVTLLWVCALQQASVLNEEDTVSSSFYNPLSSSERIYKNNGYLVIIANGGLNQRRLAIVDMIVIARYINVTLIVPLFDNKTYWNDKSTFADIFDLNHFITSLRDEVRIVEELPPELKRREESESIYSMVPISFASLTYYYQKVIPRIQKRGVLHFSLTDARLANNGLPDEVQKLRCRVNYDALKFTRPIEETGRKIVSLLRQKGPVLVLHIRYEKDMVAFTGCVQGLTKEEIKEVKEMRYSYEEWKHKTIDAKRRREHGSCPLTPEETALILQALGIDRNTTIYIAAGKIYNEEKRMENLAMVYPNLVRKELVLEPSDLKPFLNHADQMAALDYIVAIESDVFIPTFGGNMAKAVEGHRRYLGFKTTVLLNREILVKLIDDYRKGRLSWDEFAVLVKKSHEHRTGKPGRRREIRDHPRHEDFFYSNPQECLPPIS
ncbi:uncharacterized protein At1g04910-like [Herrania umbratica]|uniref:O-fucosyltransferase family protein n=1 Tax=Herrania umbratica TaxID=108875 RepID=A0A6J1B235_9ROSI|nr:uncharacterized protein At1g04910-like [Herrania umbratica]